MRKSVEENCLAIYSGCAIRPTATSETARQDSKIMEGDRREEEVKMAANTKLLLIMEVNINGTLNAQVTMAVRNEALVAFSCTDPFIF